MPAPTVTRYWPPAAGLFPDPSDLRPASVVSWSGGVGPFNVLHEWAENAGFTVNLQQDLNPGATSPDTGAPPIDLGPTGTTWYHRITVTDTSDSASTTTATATLDWWLAELANRFLYLLAEVTVAFTPQDDPAGGWGPAPDAIGADGTNELLRRFLYLLAEVTAGFDPIDRPNAGGPINWGPATTEPADGYAEDLNRYLYLLANIDTTTPTPHIWYLIPTFGREGWQFDIVGYGFGDSQATFAGTVTLDGTPVGILTWQGFAESASTLIIDPTADIAEPEHQRIEAVVPVGATSGLVIVCTDGP